MPGMTERFFLYERETLMNGFFRPMNINFRPMNMLNDSRYR